MARAQKVHKNVTIQVKMTYQACIKNFRREGVLGGPEAHEFLQFESENMASPGTKIVHNQHPQKTEQCAAILSIVLRSVALGANASTYLEKAVPRDGRAAQTYAAQSAGHFSLNRAWVNLSRGPTPSAGSIAPGEPWHSAGDPRNVSVWLGSVVRREPEAEFKKKLLMTQETTPPDPFPQPEEAMKP
ncbi:hypothetical protein PoB_002147100 [Plakobranchus ocellatus]|uniref:Uncharacterized protein n=1 Tax=Plakobranchus ocellatus TaxID=259542 RepID=A0AAV3ZGD2_9GAST|nr:hypothetical protein PoB_002147100 [Plakobranchus ocellatus]